MSHASHAATAMVVALASCCGCVDAQDEALRANRAAQKSADSESTVDVWRDVHRMFLVRTAPDGQQFGDDAVDPLLWPETNYLLTGDSHRQALELLDRAGREAAAHPGEPSVARALLQHDLWAVFDWTLASPPDEPAKHDQARGELRVRLAPAIRRLALTESEIAALPDNYELTVASHEYGGAFDPSAPDKPFLPADLFRADGPWVCLTNAGAANSFAEMHQRDCAGRSTFLVFLSLPGGRAATLDFVEQLGAASEAWKRATFDSADSNSTGELPKLPVGAQFALVRRMNLISIEGTVVASPITQSVQVWVERNERAEGAADRGPAATQSFFEFLLDRKQLLAGRKNSLRAVGIDERVFSLFLTVDWDPFETGEPLRAEHRPQVRRHCVDCHRTPGTRSFMSYTRLFTSPRGESAPLLKPTSPEREAELAVKWKTAQIDWARLHELFESKASSSDASR